jgi:hypothetical protein
MSFGRSMTRSAAASSVEVLRVTMELRNCQVTRSLEEYRLTHALGLAGVADLSSPTQYQMSPSL